MTKPLHTRCVLKTAFILASTLSLAAIAAPDGTVQSNRVLERFHVLAHNEQGDVSPLSEPRTSCYPGAPWFTGIGHLDAGYESDALGISQDGHVVVGMSTGINHANG